MNIEETKNYYELSLSDDYGDAKLRILKRLNQIQFETKIEDDGFGEEVYFNCNRQELESIRDFIDHCLNNSE